MKTTQTPTSVLAVVGAAPAPKRPVIGAQFSGPCEFLDTRAGLYRCTLGVPDEHMLVVQTALIGGGCPGQEPPLHLRTVADWCGMACAAALVAVLAVQMLRADPAPAAPKNCIPGAGWLQCSGALNRAAVSL